MSGSPPAITCVQPSPARRWSAGEGREPLVHRAARHLTLDGGHGALVVNAACLSASYSAGVWWSRRAWWRSRLEKISRYSDSVALSAARVGQTRWPWMCWSSRLRVEPGTLPSRRCRHACRSVRSRDGRSCRGQHRRSRSRCTGCRGGVVDYAAGGPSLFAGHGKGTDGELGSAALADRPTDHAARAEIEDPGEVRSCPPASETRSG